MLMHPVTDTGPMACVISQTQVQVAPEKTIYCTYHLNRSKLDHLNLSRISKIQECSSSHVPLINEIFISLFHQKDLLTIHHTNYSS